MKIRLWSDIHLEFGDMKFTERLDDHETVLVIAGDFQVGNTNFEFLRELCQKFKAVVYTPGNHEYYGQVIQKLDKEFVDLADSIQNFHFLNPGYAIIDDVKFVGATLWTDFKKGDPIIMKVAQFCMNDYRKIKYVYSTDGSDTTYYPIQPSVIAKINSAHRKFICDEIDKGFNGKLVVVSHHPPIEECTKQKFSYDPEDQLIHAYCNTGLEPWIEKCDYWLHGHIHDRITINFGKCQIIARPRGYIGHQECAKEYDDKHLDAGIIEL